MDTLGECCSVRLIQGVRLIQVLIDNVMWGVKCHSNEQWKRLEYSQRLWRYTFALISLFKWTNWSYYHKHRLQLKFEEIRWVKQALYKQNEIKNNTILWNLSNKSVKSRFFNVKIEKFVSGNLSHFRCLTCWVVEFSYKFPFNTGWQYQKWPYQVLSRCPHPLNRGVRIIQVSLYDQKNKVWLAQ